MKPELIADGRKFVSWYETVGEGLAELQPLSVELGARPVRVSTDEGFARLQFNLAKKFANYMGKVHGGIIATALDETIGVASCSRVGRGFRGTIDLHTVYIAPVSAGEVFAEAVIERETATHLVVNARLETPQSVLLARATGIVAYGDFKA